MKKIHFVIIFLTIFLVLGFIHFKYNLSEISKPQAIDSNVNLNSESIPTPSPTIIQFSSQTDLEAEVDKLTPEDFNSEIKLLMESI